MSRRGGSRKIRWIGHRNSIVHKEGHIDDDVRNIIVAGLLRSTSGLLCESPDSFSIKGEF